MEIKLEGMDINLLSVTSRAKTILENLADGELIKTATLVAKLKTTRTYINHVFDKDFRDKYSIRIKNKNAVLWGNNKTIRYCNEQTKRRYDR